MRGARVARWVSTAALPFAVSCAGSATVDPALQGKSVTPPVAAAAQGAAAVRAEAGDAAVVFVVLDGVRWQDVFVGTDPTLAASARLPVLTADTLMPHLHALLAERGAAIGAPGDGAPMVASGPNFVSLPGYNEIFSGRSPTRCPDNDCGPASLPTLADEVRATSSRPSDVAVIASWPKIERASSVAPTTFVLSTGRTRTLHEELLRDDALTAHWLDAGSQAAPYPGYDDYRPDIYTAAVALRYLETKQPRFLFMGLGEPDEYCHRDDYAGYLGSLRAADDVIGSLFATLDRMGERGRKTTVFVTADHGRGRDFRMHGKSFPESDRVWLVAAGAGIAARGMGHSTRRHRLADVAPTARELLGLPADTSPTAGAPIDELFASPPVRSASAP